MVARLAGTNRDEARCFSERPLSVRGGQVTPSPYSAPGLVALFSRFKWLLMNLFEIEIGRSYKCDRKDGQYIATVKHKQDGQIGVALHNESASDFAQGDDSRELIWLKPEDIHPRG